MKYHVQVSGRSVGGSSYLVRILKAARFRKRVHVLVEHGEMQEQVIRKIKRDLLDLNTISKTSFEVRLFAEARQY